jgi:formamidopyrimidine-DNA glycosylase
VPELPEVETTRRGIAPHIVGHQVIRVTIRQPRLRWPIPRRLQTELPGQRIEDVNRRGKYLLLHTGHGSVIIHLGMSGSLHVVDNNTAPQKHDHIDIAFDHGVVLRLRDPRRFGAVLWTTRPALQHKLLQSLGPEPLSEEFNADYLYQRSRKRRNAIKTFIMDSKVVVGVGNIYANEALFLAGIRPTVAAGRISRPRYQALVAAIKQVLTAAIHSGGTTLRDFTNSQGKPGYFQQQLLIYGKEGEGCPQCGADIRLIRQAQRASYYCPHCQR